MSKYAKYLFIMVLFMLMTATAVSAQESTETLTLNEIETEEECAAFLGLGQVEGEAVEPAEGVSAGSATDALLGQVHVAGQDMDGPFRSLGGQNPARDYRAELQVKYDADGTISDADEDFFGFVIDETTGQILNEVDLGGSWGFFLDKKSLCAVAPNGMWFILLDKGRQGENLPGTGRIVPPGSMLFWGVDGGHGWGFAGANPSQIRTELGLYFGPFTRQQLDAEQARVEAEMRRVNSVLTLDLPVTDGEDAAG